MAGIAKAGLAGLGVLAVPLMSWVIAPQLAASIMLPILVAADMLGIWGWRGRCDWRVLNTVLPGAVIGIVLGALVFGLLDVRWIKLILGVECVLFVAHRVFARASIEARAADRPRWPAGTFWGTLSGFTSTIAHAGAPPLMHYFLPLKLERERLVGTVVFYFTIINATKLLPYGLLGLLDFSSLSTSLVLAPAVPIGYWIGLKLVRNTPERVFYWLLIGTLFLSGIKLCWDGVTG